MAMAAPVFQQTIKECTSSGLCSGLDTEQNAFFNARNMEPLVLNEGFRYVVDLLHRLVQSSNCVDELRPPGSNAYARGR
jgi:hypothetical protein